MLKQVTAVRFIKRMSSGRTFPCLLECEDQEGAIVELVVKYSAKLFEKEKNLACEAIAAMLAADLDLPLPEPFIVKLEPDFIDVVPDAEVRAAMKNSCQLAFGSTFVRGYAAWPRNQKVPKGMTIAAAEIFAFDQIIVNSDRCHGRPNCLFSGEQPLIFDHELTFTLDGIVGWKAPWQPGGFSDDIATREHIFSGSYYEVLPQNLERFASAWENLDPQRFAHYVQALPVEWLYDTNHLAKLKSYLDDIKLNIRTVTKNALEVLK